MITVAFGVVLGLLLLPLAVGALFLLADLVRLVFSHLAIVMSGLILVVMVVLVLRLTSG